jgi:hypothetical protein
MAATVEESTPPDMATAIVSWFGMQVKKAAEDARLPTILLYL